MSFSKSILMVCLLSVSGFIGPIQAGELHGHEMEESIKVGDKTLVLNGMGLRSVSRYGLKIKVYIIGLYLPKKSTSEKEVLKDEVGPKVFRMSFHRNVDSEDIEKGWKESFGKNCGQHCEDEMDKLKKFNKLMSDMRTKQIIQVTVFKDKVDVDVRGRKPAREVIEGENFARIIEKIWLGSHPPNEELKQGILGLKKN